MDTIQNLIAQYWDEVIVVLLLVNNFVKGLRDAIDKTPQTDDNLFERIVTISGKLAGYIVLGKRVK